MLHRLSLLSLSVACGLTLLSCARPAPVCSASTKGASGPRAARAPVELAVTLDDAPGGLEGAADVSKRALMQQIVSTLERHHVPGAVAFVNGSLVTDADAHEALRLWTDAGYTLGNHTYSHHSARALTPGAFLADVERNERLLASLSPPTHGRYFRYPYLERGARAEDRAHIARALAQRGYRVADVSVDFSDWAYAEPYARCLGRGDEPALQALRESYLEQALASLFWAVESSERVLGRRIPHVLLLHAREPTANNLDALLSAYERAGVRFVSLERALEDPAYAESADPSRGDTTLLYELARRTQRPLQSGVPRPLALLSLACR